MPGNPNWTQGLGLGGSPAAVCSARRRIEPGDIRYATDARARGVGWQNIANQLGLNRDDIRRAVEGRDAEAAEAYVKAPRGRVSAAVAKQLEAWDLKALAVVARDPSNQAEVACALGIPEATDLCLRLARRDLIHRGWGKRRYVVTDRGREVLAAAGRGDRP